MMRPTLLTMALCGCGAAFGAESASDCAAIADPAARLACYDEKHGKATPAPAPVPAAPVAAPAVPAAAPVAPGTAPAAEFGMERPQPVQEVKSISARIVGKVPGWKRGTQFKLDNGQVWRVLDDDDRTYAGIPENPEVTISQSMFGAYWMEIIAARARIKVKRVS